MCDQVLVAYASKYGGTAGIAEKIGQVLQQAGLHTVVQPAGRVRDLTPYRAVVLGSAVYMGGWRKDAVKFLRANEKALSERPVWLFSSGPTGHGDQDAFIKGKLLPEALQPSADLIRPRDITVFHGVIDAEKLNPLYRWMTSKVEAPIGDYRDWDIITSWATAIADVLKEKNLASGTPSEQDHPGGGRNE